LNLRHLSDENLLRDTETLVHRERSVVTDILHHLREIDRRRLFLKLGFRSLFDYCVRKLAYSEDQAYRRIAAMRLLKELPQIEEKLNSGAVSLTNVSVAQKLFRHEKREGKRDFTAQQKLEVLEKLENKSAREAEKVVYSLFTNPPQAKKELVRAVAPDLNSMRFNADNETVAMIERLKELVASSHPNISLAQLIKMLCRLGIETWDPNAKKSKLQQKQRVRRVLAVTPLQDTSSSQIVIVGPSDKL
jgi:hypothetical protein